MRRMIKILTLFIVLYVVTSISCYASAASGFSILSTFSEMRQQTKQFIQTGEENTGDIIEPDTLIPIKNIASILTTIAIAVFLGATAYMGIRYLTSGPEARAKLRAQLIGLVVSGVVIFGAYSIWKIVITVASNF